MAKDYAALQVIIKLKGDGMALYPNFNNLPSVQSSGLDWSRYIDIEGLGWHYDKTSGHNDDTTGSPRGTQLGVIIVPETMADEAVAAFPDTCSLLDESELEDFYNTKAHAHEPDEFFDMQVLEGIKMKLDLGLELTSQQTDAINPDSDVPGIKKNKKKNWNSYKTLVGASIVHK